MVGCWTDSQFPDELADNTWRLPSMYGKADADALVMLKGVFTCRLQFVGNEVQLLLCGGS